ncbi:uncharacterized protein PHALS_08416 [Plasmopara halstedii]|uniref:Uncharacterized protein n=1 Tax=Plasmopara halstedii TaxID=4781 RepID=A0A0P1ACZ0_PLAHL|nr:uncharacterized protein PHALS_08416 [Plasmopara halstedii]CEG38335.1 hypothetical protein PHALS_08416 [Plasmopara halstedii]|eukprot:XP_024574704.1 hypothetical protein PHALS_08416 [Plasmopara halstedii]
MWLLGQSQGELKRCNLLSLAAHIRQDRNTAQNNYELFVKFSLVNEIIDSREMAKEKGTLAEIRARMTQHPNSWVDVMMVSILQDPVFYGVLAFGVVIVLVIIALFATKILLDQIAAEEKQKEGRVIKKQQ